MTDVLTRDQFLSLVGNVRANGSFPDTPFLAFYDHITSQLDAEQKRVMVKAQLLELEEEKVARLENRLNVFACRTCYCNMMESCEQNDPLAIETKSGGVVSWCRCAHCAIKARVTELEAALNTPEILDFAKAVNTEAAHQRERWGMDHDSEKTDADWFWLVGYLAGKALHLPEKRLHHLVTTAAALANWHHYTIKQEAAFKVEVQP